MGSRRGSAAILAAGVLGGAGLVSACGSGATAFRPTGSLPRQAASGPAALSPASAEPGVGLEFETPLPAGALPRAIVIGYEAYARARWAGRRGAVPTRYFDTAVTGVYFGNGASVSSCVDASGRRYLEEAAEGRRGDGSWLVTHVQIYPTSSSQGAGCR